MKIIISLMMITIGVLVFFVVDTDTNTATDKSASQQQSLEAYSADDLEHMATQENTTSSNNNGSKPTDESKLYAHNSSDNKDINFAYSENNSSYADTDSAYNPVDSGSDNSGSSYNQYSSNYSNSSPSYSQNNMSYGDTESSNSQASSTSANSNFSDNEAGSDSLANNDEQQDDSSNDDAEATDETEQEEETEDTQNIKYQRLYDNGIMWSGNTGTLMVEYQSSHAETTGIGFRVHFDSSSMRPINVQQYPVDAIVTTTANSMMPDKNNRDNNPATNHFLTFAWASIYGQWPQTNQVSLATIEFEKVNGGSTNYMVNYSSVSVPAGFRLIK